MRKILWIVLMCGVAAGMAQAEERFDSAHQKRFDSAHHEPALKIPQIKIVTEDVDLGEIKKGGILDYKIEVRNTGKADLIIENVYSGCGCLEVTDERWAKKKEAAAAEKGLSAAELIRLDNKAISATKVTIKPGGNIFISARLDTNKVSGALERMLHIISNDPQRKDVLWKVKGNVLDSPPKNVGGSLEQYSSSVAEK